MLICCSTKQSNRRKKKCATRELNNKKGIPEVKHLIDLRSNIITMHDWITKFGATDFCFSLSRIKQMQYILYISMTHTRHKQHLLIIYRYFKRYHDKLTCFSKRFHSSFPLSLTSSTSCVHNEFHSRASNVVLNVMVSQETRKQFICPMPIQEPELVTTT